MARVPRRFLPLAYRAARFARKTERWLVAKLAFAVLALLRRLPADRALNWVDWAARKAGPLLGRHRTALDNIRLAYPEKSDEEIGRIASDMWGNMARLAAEYIFMETLFDYHPSRLGPSRIEIVGGEIFDRLRDERKPHILFTAHLGNFELLPVAAAAFGLDLAALFRAPNNPYLAEMLLSARSVQMGEMVRSKSGASFALAGVLDRGGNIGLLVDQKFAGGARGTFFGRECESSPLLAKLARHYDCEVYPARCMRLPGNRFRLEVSEAIVLPRNERGVVDVLKTTQVLNDIVEGWVREAPGQWMWFHKRWKIRAVRPRRRIRSRARS